MDPIFAATPKELKELDFYLAGKIDFKLYVLIEHLSLLAENSSAAYKPALIKIVEDLCKVMHSYKIDINSHARLQFENQRFKSMSEADQKLAKKHLTEHRAELIPQALEDIRLQISMNIVELSNSITIALCSSLIPELYDYLQSNLAGTSAITKSLSLVLSSKANATSTVKIISKLSTRRALSRVTIAEKDSTLPEELANWKSSKPAETAPIYKEWKQLKQLINFFMNSISGVSIPFLWQNTKMLIHCSHQYCTNSNPKAAAPLFAAIQSRLTNFFPGLNPADASLIVLLVQMLPEKNTEPYQTLYLQLSKAVHDYFMDDNSTILLQKLEGIITEVSTKDSDLNTIIASLLKPWQTAKAPKSALPTMSAAAAMGETS